MSPLARIDNPPNPHDRFDVEWLGPPPPAHPVVYAERSRSILSKNSSPDVPFDWSLNPYRGCQHACSYCYARRDHERLGFGAGTDFETRLVVKTNAAELLEAALAKASWRGEPIAFSGDTDCYQPLEAHYRLTRGCLEVCAAHRNPVSILTKSPMILRDLDLLERLAAAGAVRVAMSLAFHETETARVVEPATPVPSARLRALETLSRAGIPTGILLAPIVPGLNDAEIPALLEAAADAGARWAAMLPLRLPGPVGEVFVARLRASHPTRADKILARLDELRAGRRDENRPHHRQAGHGAYFDMVRSLFELHRERLGLGLRSAPFPADSPFKRPGELF